MKWLFGLLLFGLLTTSSYASTTSHLVIDVDSKHIVSASNEKTIRPVASITKLMTALIILESNLDMDQKVPYQGGIFKNKQVSRAELLESLLIRSDNAAAEALALSVYGGRSAFISAMNLRAQSLGMTDTSFEDPSGIGRNNLSTAVDISKLIEQTYQFSKISNTSSTKFFKVEIKNKQKITFMTVVNTNSQLLDVFSNITLSKTGFTNSAGRCLGLMVDEKDHRYAVVILGEKTAGERFKKAQHLINLISK